MDKHEFVEEINGIVPWAVIVMAWVAAAHNVDAERFVELAAYWGVDALVVQAVEDKAVGLIVVVQEECFGLDLVKATKLAVSGLQW